MKRVISWLLIAACIGFVGYVVYTFSSEQTIEPPLWTAVPADAALVVQVNDPLKASDYLSHYDLEWSTTASLLLKNIGNEEWSKYLYSPQCIISSTEAGQGVVMVVGLQKTTTLETIESAILGITGGTKGAERNFEGQSIVPFGDYTVCITNQLLFFGNSEALIESAIRSTLDDGKNIDQHLITLKNKSANDTGIVFFGKWKKEEWMSIEPHQLDENSWYYTGMIAAPDSTKMRFNWSKSSDAFGVGNYLPANTVAAEVWSFDDFQAMREAFDKGIENTNEEKFTNASWIDIGDSCLCDLNEALLDWRGGVQGSFLYESNGKLIPISFATVIDSLRVEELMGTLATPLANNLLELKYQPVQSRYFQSAFLVNPVYGIQAGDVFFKGEDPDALTAIKADIQSNNTLQRSKNINEWMGKDGSGLHYFGGKYLTALFPPSLQWFFNKEGMNGGTMKKQENGIIVVEWFEGEIKSAAETAPTAADTITDTTSVVTEEAPAAPVEPEPATPSTKKWNTINHNTKEKEVFLQLKDNTILLQTSGGKELWKAAMSDPIIGDVTQVDVLKNGKLQFAFTTKRALYIIDRNGKSLPGFPLKLKSDVTTGLSAFDYSNDLNYRLIFGCANGSILNYTVAGTPTPGWQYTTGPVAKKIIFEKKNGKEQLVITFQSGESRTYKKNGTPQ